MDYEVKEIVERKKDYLELLLLADEQEDMIYRYLEKGRMFVLSDQGEARSAAVVLELSREECELKSLATFPRDQGRGYGRAMVAFLLQKFLGPAQTGLYRAMLVGTGEVPRILRFYQRCGFQPSHRLPNFFTDNYRHPIIEDGFRLVDMIYLRAEAWALSEGGI